MTDRGMDRRGLLKAGALAGLGGLAAGWTSARAQETGAAAGDRSAELEAARDRRIVETISAEAEELPDIAAPDFADLADRFAEARVVLLGESTHGTDEFYRARAAITERLVTRHGFTIVAVEADWPDAARVDAYVRAHAAMPSPLSAFQRFPVWMWRNRAVRDFVERLREINEGIAEPERKVGFYGIDLYSLPSSMDAVVEFLTNRDPLAAEQAREKYGCLAPWVDDPATYGALARAPEHDSCAENVGAVVEQMLKDRLSYIESHDLPLFQAIQNARVVAASEAYYRAMYEGTVASWNLRDTHMFETLQSILEARGPDAKAVVWAHNSHVGNAAATGMGLIGQINIGQLSRQRFGDDAVLVGFGTDRGTVTAASRWGGPSEVKDVRPSLPQSYGALMREAGPDRFLLDIKGKPERLSAALQGPRLERYIGVIYRPETERVSHYSEASLAREYDLYLWFEETRAVEPLTAEDISGLPRTHPFSM